MTRQELTHYDGREGRKAYAAVNGKVYDFTASKLWPGGDHQGQHQAGTDLTEALRQAPHVRAVIERFPVVDELVDVAPPSPQNDKTPIIIGAAVLIGAMILGVILLVR